MSCFLLLHRLQYMQNPKGFGFGAVVSQHKSSIVKTILYPHIKYGCILCKYPRQFCRGATNVYNRVFQRLAESIFWVIYELPDRFWISNAVYFLLLLEEQYEIYMFVICAVVRR